MASRAEHKQQARARRLADEQTRAERSRRRRRLYTLGGVAFAAVAVVAVAITVSASTGGSTGLTKGSGETTLVAQVRQLLAGIPQSGVTLGNPRAPVTLTYYSDLQCPVCAEFTLNSGFPKLVANDVRAGRVKIVYRAVKTATRDPQTFQAQQRSRLSPQGGSPISGTTSSSSTDNKAPKARAMSPSNTSPGWHGRFLR